MLEIEFFKNPNMTKNTKVYSIEEICEAWEEFTRPIYLYNAQKIRSEDIEKMSKTFATPVDGDVQNTMTKLEVDYSLWIPFLIVWKHKEPENKI